MSKSKEEIAKELEVLYEQASNHTGLTKQVCKALFVAGWELRVDIKHATVWVSPNRLYMEVPR